LTLTATDTSGITFTGACVLTIPTAGAVTVALLGTANAFTLDNTINGLTVGRGGGNYAENVALGTNAGTSNTGQYCSAIGYYALKSNTGSSCNAVGVTALTSNTGTSCNAVGYATLYGNTGAYCNAVGNYALDSNTGANCNAFGYNAGKFIANGTTPRTTGDSGLFIGNNTKTLALAQNNQIVIGDSAIGAGANSVTLGNTSITTTVLRSQLKLMKGAGYMTADVVEATGVTTLTTSPAGGFVFTPPVTFSDNVTLTTAKWLGLGAAAGRLTFTDAATDMATFSNCDLTVSASGNTTLKIDTGIATNSYSRLYLLGRTSGNAVNDWRLVADNGIDGFVIYGGNGTSLDYRLVILGNGNVGIGTPAPAGKTTIDQSSTTDAIPVIELDQADVSEEMINFIVAATGAGDPVDTATAVGTAYARLRIAVNGTFKYLQVYNA
jgi:hypothetical protein